MASQASFVVQNENLHLHAGKGAGGAKVDVPKSEQKGRKVRKPLADISRTGKPSVAKASFSKERLVMHDNRKAESTTKVSDLTEKEIKRCNEHDWDKEGIEHTHFSGNDLSALQKDIAEKRVEKKVEKVITALSEWIQISHGIERPAKEPAKDPEEFMKLEPDPEVILPVRSVPLSTSVDEKFDDLFVGESYVVWPIRDLPFDLKLKEENEGDLVCF